jgi:hypothetical protein
MKGTSFLPFLVLVGDAFFGLFLAFPFVFHVMVLAIGFYWIFWPCFIGKVEQK